MKGMLRMLLLFLYPVADFGLFLTPGLECSYSTIPVYTKSEDIPEQKRLSNQSVLKEDTLSV